MQSREEELKASHENERDDRAAAAFAPWVGEKIGFCRT